jgi:hypothetical protein
MCGAALTLPMALKGIGTGLSVFSAISGGMQQSAYAKYQSKQAVEDAKYARGAAMVRAEKIRKAGEIKQSEARLSLAGSGVDVNAGTSVEINKKIGANAEEDALTEILDGNNQAARLNQQAEAYKISGSNAKTAGYLNAGASALGYKSKENNLLDKSEDSDSTSVISQAPQLYKGWKRSIN